MPAATHGRDRTSSRRWDLLVVSLLAVAVVAVIGNLATDTGPESWYAGLEQPAWEPPDWIFGPVWSVLYLAMAVAAWLVARRGLGLPAVRGALILYGLQLALNLAWTLVFFGLEAPAAALAVIVSLALAILLTMWSFFRINRLAGALLLPYLAWVAYASALNAAIVSLS